ncbi:hypothetical protein Tsubulata_042702 [Turnera subulata]|uniref:C3H1-type domain-containing protein n=1 Tax=Turnera subulata TaxID=218843 RepID=A0A9Q0GK38_9ROSI|nr:hypothetical protein Tsubulata_042702 [Turnera subulata]
MATSPPPVSQPSSSNVRGQLPGSPHCQGRWPDHHGGVQGQDTDNHGIPLLHPDPADPPSLPPFLPEPGGLPPPPPPGHLLLDLRPPAPAGVRGRRQQPLRWLYETFQSLQPDLQLVVFRFLSTIAGLYLSRVTLGKPLAGFEAVLGCDGGEEVAGDGGVGAEVVEDELGLDLVEVSIIFLKKTMANEPVNVSESQELARQALPRIYYDFLRWRGAEDQQTLKENVEAFTPGTGDCKFGSSCMQIHHPPELMIAPKTNVVLSPTPMGLPLRPGAPTCTHALFSTWACRFDHPMGTLSYSPPSASSLADMPVAPYISCRLRSSIGTLAP